MDRWPDEPALHAISARMREVCRRLRLPLRQRAWRGQTGNWQGAGIGSSIDFQDHRPYLPGDDPRYIDWQAYARTGHYSMKLYREEVSPRVDLALDVSDSMFFDDAKRLRALELFTFSIENAHQAGVSVRSHLAGVVEAIPWKPGAPLSESDWATLRGPVLGGDLGNTSPSPVPPTLARVPWRQGSLRVLISDLLFPGSPDPHLAQLAAAKGRGVILAPFCAAEAEPDALGNVEMIDCETSFRTARYLEDETLAQYRHGYARHFELWREHARRHGVLVARVRAEGDFQRALQGEALQTGAVELTH